MPDEQHSYHDVKYCLAALLRGEEFSIVPDSKTFIEVAHAEGVTALAYHKLRHLAVWKHCPADLQNALAKATYQETALEMTLVQELRKVLQLLAEHHLPVLIMKGAALAYTLYPRPYLRSRCDTDLLLPSRKEAERASTVLQMIGYEQPMDIPGDLICHELGCYKTTATGLTHALDIHWGLSNAVLFAGRFSFAELQAIAVPIPELAPHAYGFDPKHAFLLACMHRVNNLWPGIADRLIWLYDIHLLAESFTEQQWQTLIQLAENHSLCGPCLDGINKTHEFFKTAIPDSIHHRFKAGALKEGFNPKNAQIRWRYKWLAFRHLPSTTIRLRWLLQYVFPDIQYMRNRYHFKKNIYLPWFYGVRIVQEIFKEIILKRHKPKLSKKTGECWRRLW